MTGNGPLMPPDKKEWTTTFGGVARCRRCQAQSKRSDQQCKKPAVRGKRVCRTHGGASTGPKTEAGRKRCAAAKTIHGRETRAIRRIRSQKLKELDQLAKLIGL